VHWFSSTVVRYHLKWNSMRRLIHRQTAKQAGWFVTARLRSPSSECPHFRMPPSCDCCTLPHRRFNQNIPSSVVLLQQCHCQNRHRGKLQKSISSVSFVRIESKFFFTTHRRHRLKKWWTRILKFELCDFWEFLKFSKRRRAVPLQPIWTIMVAAKLDQSRVLVTKFRQNRSTLKGRSAGQRQTDTHTDRQTRMKIRALQVCNRANRETDRQTDSDFCL